MLMVMQAQRESKQVKNSLKITYHIIAIMLVLTILLFASDSFNAWYRILVK